MSHLKLDAIRIDGGTQQRPCIDSKVLEYAELLKEEIELPPVEVIYDGMDYWLWDGFHRYQAHRQIKSESIPVKIAKGSKRDAVWLSFSANKKHGIQRTTDAIRKIILKIDSDSKWSEKTDEQIAQHVGCTRQYVSRIRGENKENSGHEEDFIAEEQEESSVPKKPAISHKETKPSVIMDCEKHKIELGQDYYQQTRKALHEHVESLQKSLREVEAAVSQDSERYAFFEITTFRGHLQNAINSIEFAIPHAVCPYCGGRDAELCKVCKKTGFVPKEIYHVAPKEFKKRS